ncbi:MAG: ABC transporter permease [Chloroflexota bacterium]|nr:ABC transporter permease [Chloroflexota bacterium]
MLRMTYRNLVHEKVRLVIAVSGVALALILMLSLDAIVTGIEDRIAVYIEQSGADVFVSQAGVRNLHMATSSIPSSVLPAVQAVPGVASATPILYRTDYLLINHKRFPAYAIGLPPDARAGGPRRIARGQAFPTDGGIIVDRAIADTAGATLGDHLTLFGRDLTIVGLSEGTASSINSVAFITFHDFAQARGDAQSLSFVLVTTSPGETPTAVAARIEQTIPGVTALSRQAFAGQERQIVSDMSTDVLTIMNAVGFLIGLAVVAVTIYLATFTRRAEYGVLKAVGARNSYLYRSVLLHALAYVLLGLIAAFVGTLLLSMIVPHIVSSVTPVLRAGSLVNVAGIALVIAGLASVLPIAQLARLDPAMVFKGGTKK